jgi:hypothetical protein
MLVNAAEAGIMPTGVKDRRKYPDLCLLLEPSYYKESIVWLLNKQVSCL